MLWQKRHACTIPGCTITVDATHLMCFAHWALANPALQLLYWRMRHNGKPRDGFDEVCRNIIMQVEEIVLAEGGV